MNNLINALVFIITTIADLYVTVILARVLLQLIRAPFKNQICQFIVTVTDPGFKLLRRVIPGYNGIDFAGVMFAGIITVTEITLITLLKYHTLPSIWFYIYSTVTMLVGSILSIYLWAIIIRVISSFMAQGYQTMQNPLFELTYIITEPVLRRIRDQVPTVSGFDLSPFIACALIVVIKILFNIS